MNIDLKIYEPTKINQQEEKLDFYLKLNKCQNGDIDLIAVDKNGNEISYGNLISIRTNGKLFFYKSVNNKLGFPLDNGGELQLYGDDDEY